VSFPKPLNSGWDVIHKMKFSNTKLNKNTKCAQIAASIMPLAVARPFVRPFVKEFVNDEIINMVR